MPSSRPCRYCLGLQDDSVFADFDVDSNGHVFLVRISFDGYGCCNTAGRVSTMSLDMSERLICLVDANDVASGELAAILSEYLRENCDVMWKDALDDHGLLND